MTGSAPDDAEVVVVEMGARGRGHIAELCATARPTVGVVTVVAGAHLEQFGSLDDVAGLCDETGLVLGLMPHPEDHVLMRQHPRRSRGETAGNALPLFLSGVRRAAQS